MTTVAEVEGWASGLDAVRDLIAPRFRRNTVHLDILPTHILASM